MGERKRFMAHDSYQASAEDRSRFFWWLAEWFLEPPGPQRLAALPRGPQGSGATSDADRAWQVLADAAAGTLDGDALAVEYTRLFSGIQEGLGPPPPFESLWREDRLIGETTVAVIDAYARAGFADIDPAAGPQDHIAVELKFLALLALREAQAWQAGDTALARERIGQQREFIARHLAAWAPRWAQSVALHSREPLFAALAGLVAPALDDTRAELDQTVESFNAAL